MQIIATAARRHWFYLVWPFLLAAALMFRATHPWSDAPGFGEATTLFDWCVFVPALHAICYRAMPRRALALRTLALICGGAWIAGKIVPDSAEVILAQWSWLRAPAMAVLLLAEGMALIAIVRLTFAPTPDSRALEKQGLPPLVVKLMLAEARFWRWLWARIRGR
jgi:hypothetical protein